MRVFGVLAAWGLLAIAATLSFMLGSALGYRRGVLDAARQLHRRRSGDVACNPLPTRRMSRRPVGRSRARTVARGAAVRVLPSRRMRPHRPPRRPEIRVPTHVAAEPRRPALTAAAVVAVAVLAVPGLAVASTATEPGGALWGMKVGVERTRLALVRDPVQRADLHVDLAERRLDELDTLVDADADAAAIAQVSGDLRTHTLAATQSLATADEAPDDELGSRVSTLADAHVELLDATGCDNDCDTLEDARVASEVVQDQALIALRAEEPGADAVGPAAPAGGTVTAEPVVSGDAADAAGAPGPTSSDAAGAATAAPAGVTAPSVQPDQPSASASASASASPTPSPSPSASAQAQSATAIDRATAPSASPTPTPSPTASASPSPSPSPTPAPAPAPTTVDGS